MHKRSTIKREPHHDCRQHTQSYRYKYNSIVHVQKQFTDAESIYTHTENVTCQTSKSMHTWLCI